MSRKLIDKFYWSDIGEQNGKELAPEEKHKRVVAWAGKARRQNPNVFDTLTEWVLDNTEWTQEKLAENEQVLMQGVFARFRDQNDRLRAYLKEIEPSGVVNDAAYRALDRFDDALSGKTHGGELQDVISRVFADFTSMGDPKVRALIAGGKTGPHGTNSVAVYGYINLLKDCDAAVQWALFMPDVVKRQQDGFQLESFEYKKLPAMRFIGRECIEHDVADMKYKLRIMNKLESMSEQTCGFDYDILLMHHYGKGVDVERWHEFWGRFMKADTPVPEGFISFDFIPQRDLNNFNAGPPFLSQFAFATFSGDPDAMHSREGYDSDAMYDVTRNIMLGQGVNIPYPDKYWTAEVFLDGCDKYSTAYLFSAEL